MTACFVGSDASEKEKTCKVNITSATEASSRRFIYIISYCTREGSHLSTPIIIPGGTKFRIFLIVYLLVWYNIYVGSFALSTSPYLMFNIG
jgi:hypothetical protein